MQTQFGHHGGIIFRLHQIQEISNGHSKIEKVQMKTTKYMCRGKDLSYDDRLRRLKLPTLN